MSQQEARRFQETSEEVEVRKEDQEKINEFGVVHQELTDISADRKAVDDELMFIEDAEQEVMLSGDSETFQIRMGATYVSVGEDEFNDYIEKKRAELEGSRKKMDTRSEKLSARKTDLKATLYARFGTTINLDD